MIPKMIQRKRSVRPRGKNSTPWVPLQGLLNSEKEINKYGNDDSVTAKSTLGDNKSSCVSERVPKPKKKKGEHTKTKLLEVRTDITQRIDPKKQGKRSIRRRGNEPTSWLSLDGLQHFEKVQVGSKMEYTTNGGTTSCNESKWVVSDVIEKTDVSVADTSVEVNNSVSTNANEQAGVLIPYSSFDLKDNKNADADANAVEQKENKMNNVEFDPEVFSGLDLDSEIEFIYFSSAESALASVYGDSARDLCIEFAVKILMNEAPLPREAAEVEEFFNQKMNNVMGKNADSSGLGMIQGAN